MLLLYLPTWAKKIPRSYKGCKTVFIAFSVARIATSNAYHRWLNGEDILSLSCSIERQIRMDICWKRFCILCLLVLVVGLSCRTFAQLGGWNRLQSNLQYCLTQAGDIVIEDSLLRCSYIIKKKVYFYCIFMYFCTMYDSFILLLTSIGTFVAFVAFLHNVI